MTISFKENTDDEISPTSCNYYYYGNRNTYNCRCTTALTYTVLNYLWNHYPVFGVD